MPWIATLAGICNPLRKFSHVALLALAAALVLGTIGGCEEEAEKEEESAKTYVANRAYVLQAGEVHIQAVSNTGTWGTATAQSSGLETTPIDVAVHPGNKFLYVPNLNSASISGYAINGSTGALTILGGSPFASTAQPYAAKFHPQGKFLFVANNGGSISSFVVNQTSGALTAAPGSPVTDGSNLVAIAVHPTGKFIYVAQGTNPGYVIGYAVNQTSGALTAIPGSPFAADVNMSGVVVNKAGKLLYASSASDDTIVGYSIDTTDGSLTELTGSPFATGNSPQSLTMDPAGRFVFTVLYNATGSNLQAFSVNSTSGDLTEVAGSPFIPYAGYASQYATSVAVDPASRYVYVTSNFATNGVDAFTINGTTGALTPISGFPLDGTNTKGVVFTRKLQ